MNLPECTYCNEGFFSDAFLHREGLGPTKDFYFRNSWA